MDSPTTRVRRATSELYAGRPVVLTGANPTDDAHLLIAAEKSTVESVSFLVRYGSGLVCAALTGSGCDRLELAPMVGADKTDADTEYTVSIDAVAPGTGISAADRAHTLRLLADSSRAANAFTRPGHVLPARTASGGVLARRGPAEAAVDLAAAAGLHRAGAFTALVSEDDPTLIADTAEAERFADAHDVAIVSIEELVEYRRTTELHLQTQFAVIRNSEYGHVHCVGYRSDVSDVEYVAYSIDSSPPTANPLVCFEREVDPAPHLSTGVATAALDAVAENGYGTVIVARRNDGRASTADICADLAEIVRDCGYRSPFLHNFPTPQPPCRRAESAKHIFRRHGLHQRCHRG
ncbi:3,4-dihydroxy-2-butanone-4-phosphate synthase [Rhodococcus pseudokoreensis]|uniref:3,4-dihydroxy-2-butanone-4-phosphate synthase n=1 Tax=Rhodococcus pseudokoreensis TaxID=2811421 RepID=A0A974ZT31_9NOCA|nr:3,4-dihydroxy-2-butanone-4-phosphate synthase [Rhodococcus pseudokoreensis]QSE89346.1 3,4-dihydroxy-2-butanone-4-phosphate synthase [Rhodococcus pseudokoreensis]